MLHTTNTASTSTNSTASSSRYEQLLLSDIASFANDPLRFVMYAFPWGTGPLAGHDGPDKWQIQVLEHICDNLNTSKPVQVAVASGHDIGKSATIAWLILWAMSTLPGTRGIVTANTESQLRTKTWPELAKWHMLAINKHWFKLTATSIMSANPKYERVWRMDAIPWSEQSPEAFAGLQNEGKRIMILYDEASAIPDIIWEVSEGATLNRNTEIIWAAFGNPTRNSGRFRECFRKFRHNWLNLRIDSRDCKLANKERIAGWVSDYGEDSDFVKVRVRGIFPSLSSLQFISQADADAAFDRKLNIGSYAYASKILSLDNAWTGKDEGVIGMRQGLKFNIMRTFAKNDNDLQVAQILANIEDSEKAAAVYIDIGYGAGVYSAGKTWGRRWRLVNSAEKSSAPGYLNKRAEMWGLMREWLKEGGAIPNDKQLLEELTNIDTVPRNDGKLQLESKIDMGKRGIPSPGRADALALTFAYPVAWGQKYQNGAFVIPDTRAKAWEPF